MSAHPSDSEAQKSAHRLILDWLASSESGLSSRRWWPTSA